MADVFEWGAIRVFLCSSVIEYLVPVSEVCIRIDLCQTFIGWNDKIIRNDNGVGFCVCKPDRQIFELQDVFIEVIDTWNMTITPAGRHSGEFTIDMPSRPYMAVRLVKVK